MFFCSMVVVVSRYLLVVDMIVDSVVVIIRLCRFGVSILWVILV